MADMPGDTTSFMIVASLMTTAPGIRLPELSREAGIDADDGPGQRT